MKKLLLILAIWFSTSASAQKIHFTDTTNVWKQYITYYNDGHGDPHYYTYSFIRDTTIDTIHYKMFNFGVVAYPGSSVLYIREDTNAREVYIRDVYNDSDMILMDYNLNVGDTFTIKYDTNLHFYNKFVVSRIDSTLINGVWYKVWHFPVTSSSFGYWDVWDIIEGIGCIQHPTFMLEPPGIEPAWQRMYCFSNKGVTLPVSPAVNHFDNLGSCTYYPHLSVSELKVGITAKIYPNPATGQITITSPNKITTLTITNILGQTIYTQNHNSEKVDLDVSHLPPGMYLVRINGSEMSRFIKL